MKFIIQDKLDVNGAFTGIKIPTDTFTAIVGKNSIIKPIRSMKTRTPGILTDVYELQGKEGFVELYTVLTPQKNDDGTPRMRNNQFGQPTKAYGTVCYIKTTDLDKVEYEPLSEAEMSFS